MIKNYIFLGAPGAGKGSIAKMVEEARNIAHISTGDIFRNNIKEETLLGMKVKSILDAGEYVPDSLTNEILKDAVTKPEVAERGFILDGYPRTIGQAQFLQEEEINITKVIYLEVSDAVVTKRLVARARGEDDKPEIIKDRLQTYHNKTKPLIDFYENEKLLVRVNAEGTMEEVLAQVLEVL